MPMPMPKRPVRVGPLRRPATLVWMPVLAALLSVVSLPVHAKQRCTDFSAYAVGALLPQRLKQDGHVFRFGNPSSIFFTGGAQFWSKGSSVTPPKPSNWVEIVYWGGAGSEITFTAINAAGGLEDTATVPITFSLNTIRLTASSSPIVQVKLKGGGNESTLNQVCSQF